MLQITPNLKIKSLPLNYYRIVSMNKESGGWFSLVGIG